MSNLDNIIQKILDDANEQANSILKETDEIKENILNKYNEKAEKEKKKILSKAYIEADALKNQVISSAKLEARDTILNAKQDIIDKVFQQAKDRLLKMSDSEYVNFLKNMLATVNLNGRYVLIVPENRKDMVKSLKLDLNISDSEIVESGFVVVAENVRYNFSFDVLLNALREEMEIEIANELFKSLD